MPKKTEPNPRHVEELVLYAENDGDLYRQRRQAIEKNLQSKFDKGTYVADKAVKLWRYFTDEAAKKYAKEYGGSFSAADRQAAALEFALAHHGEMVVQASPSAAAKRAKRATR